MLSKKRKSTNFKSTVRSFKKQATKPRVTIVRPAVKGELKFTDITLTQEFSTTGTITLLNGVAQGSNESNRVGTRQDNVSLLLRGAISVGAVATASTVRMIVVYDNQTNKLAPAITDVLTAVNTGSAMNLSNRDRFRVLLDRFEYVEASGKAIIPFNHYLKLGQSRTTYGNGLTGATVAGITTGAIFLITVGDLVTGTTAPVTKVANSRFRFSDA